MPRLATRRIAGFVLGFALVYGLLVFAWPLVGGAYRGFYCGLGNALFDGGDAAARFHPLEEGEGLDVEIVLTKTTPPVVRGRMRNDSRLVGYMPTVCLVAFVLASPIPWKRRRRALLLGLLLVHVFVALRMGIPIVREFSQENALQVYHLGGFRRWLLGVANRAFLSAPASFFVVPTFLWILVAFRGTDWQLLREPDESPPTSA